MRTQTQLLNSLKAETERLWDNYAEIWPILVRYDAPEIKLNNRFTRCAGRAWYDKHLVELGSKFFAKFEANMVRVILPHELAHIIDGILRGSDNITRYHDAEWQKIMLAIGQEPKPYHSMEI